jgi:hypothetical protein
MTQPTSAPTQTAAPPKVHRVPPWPIDIINGAFRGDYAPRLGTAGYVTQGLLGFMPFIGSCCALRDLFANLDHHDRVGVALNAFSLVPVLGGFPKTANVLRCLKNASQAASAAFNAGHAATHHKE